MSLSAAISLLLKRSPTLSSSFPKTPSATDAGPIIAAQVTEDDEHDLSPIIPTVNIKVSSDGLTDADRVFRVNISACTCEEEKKYVAEDDVDAADVVGADDVGVVGVDAADAVDKSEAAGGLIEDDGLAVDALVDGCLCSGKSASQTMYGTIELTGLSHAFMKSGMMQRLKHIKQLGILEYFGSTTNRFDHSVGVAHLARQMALLLQSRHRSITTRMVTLVELAGLLHDIGHGPRSHMFDELIKLTEGDLPAAFMRDATQKWGADFARSPEARVICSNFNRPVLEALKSGAAGTFKFADFATFPRVPNATPTHEERSCAIVAWINSTLPEQLRMTSEEVEIVCVFIDPKNFKPTRELAYVAGLDQIVNNVRCKFDVDKMDYIIRDWAELYQTPFGEQVSAMEIVANVDIIDGVLMFHLHTLPACHDLVVRRATMHRTIYQHPQSNASNMMFREALQIADRHMDWVSCSDLTIPGNMEKFMLLTDPRVTQDILEYVVGSCGVDGDDSDMAEAQKLVLAVQSGDVSRLWQYRGIRLVGTVNDKTPKEDAQNRKFASTYYSVMADSSAPLAMLPKMPAHNGFGREISGKLCKGLRMQFSTG